ncbi:NYN domain-containing protein [Caenimonas koreensis]|uniref:NYN domain-containing protein n=1 Tax=Caenimonas koreensis TaxID=367474 RepID=UPI003784C623
MSNTDSRVAVLVDCDNLAPDAAEHALRVVAQFGRVVLRRGYGNNHTIANKWQEALVRLSFTPCLQYQYAPGKNTSDIALALDAMEALFDDRADTFCLVTSDSDFAYLCRKLRERGAVVYIVGEQKTPAALRNASDQFFEWTPKAIVTPEVVAPSKDNHREETEPAEPKVLAKRRPKFVVDAVDMLVGGATEGKVGVSELGSYLKRMDPAFSPQTFGHSGLLNMLKTYDLLSVHQELGGHWSVVKVQASDAKSTPDLAGPTIAT